MFYISVDDDTVRIEHIDTDLASKIHDKIIWVWDLVDMCDLPVGIKFDVEAHLQCAMSNFSMEGDFTDRMSDAIQHIDRAIEKIETLK